LYSTLPFAKTKIALLFRILAASDGIQVLAHSIGRAAEQILGFYHVRIHD
jgi:hypothetical protein